MTVPVVAERPAMLYSRSVMGTTLLSFIPDMSTDKGHGTKASLESPGVHQIFAACGSNVIQATR